MENVADHGPGGRRDNADHRGQVGQCPLARRVEQALRREPQPTLFQNRHESPDPCGLKALDDDLVGGLARKGGDLAGGHDLHALFGLDAEAREGHPPHHGIDARALVLQRKVGMPGRMRAAVVRDLAPEPDVAEPVLHGALERARQFTDR